MSNLWGARRASLENRAVSEPIGIARRFEQFPLAWESAVLKGMDCQAHVLVNLTKNIQS